MNPAASLAEILCDSSDSSCSSETDNDLSFLSTSSLSSLNDDTNKNEDDVEFHSQSSLNDDLNVTMKKENNVKFHSQSSLNDDDLDDTNKKENHFEFHSIIKNFSNDEFRNYFHMERSTVSALKQYYAGRSRINIRHVDKTFNIFLSYICTTDSLEEIARQYGCNEYTAFVEIDKAIQWIINTGHQFVKWPNNDQGQIKHIIRDFEVKTKFPALLGILDSIHINIMPYVGNIDHLYYNRNETYSIHLQGVVDAHMKFIDIHCGEPGSMEKYEVLKESDLYCRSIENESQVFPEFSFLIGGSEYPLLNWLMTPINYNNNGGNSDCSNQHSQFNSLHSSARVYAEEAFKMLIIRFPKLLNFKCKTIDVNAVTNTVVCSCILHNFCILQNDLIDYQDLVAMNHIPGDNSENNEFQQNFDDNLALTGRQQTLLNYMIEKDVISV